MILATSFDTRNESMWENRALMYGDGVFETMRCIDHKVPLWPWHLTRLQQSLDYLQIDSPDCRAIEQIIAEQTNQGQSVLRLTVFRDQQKRGYQPLSRASHWLLSHNPLQAQPQAQSLGIANQRLSSQPLLKGFKHLNRLPQVLIANELAGQEVDDLLVFNQQGDVIETTCQNIIVIKNQQIFTPNMHDSGVEGVALAWLKQNLSVKTKCLQLHDLAHAEAVMTANAVHGFRPVKRIKSITTFQINHPICDRIDTLWQQLINSA
jgi:4-amino-4-deoxychorismate lyase